MPRPVSSSSRKRGSSPATSAIAAVCVAEILGLAGYSIVPALLPQFIEAWSLTNAQGGWLAGMVSAGYMLGVLPLVSLTDRMPARTILSRIERAQRAVQSRHGVERWSAPGTRHGARSPASRSRACICRGCGHSRTAWKAQRRARVAAWYTSSFTVGTSLSFLLGRTGILWGWRALSSWPQSSAPSVSRSPGRRCQRPPPAPPDAPSRRSMSAPVLGNRDALVLIIGYATTIWGTAGIRQWIVVFLAFCVAGKATLPCRAGACWRSAR